MKFNIFNKIIFLKEVKNNSIYVGKSKKVFFDKYVFIIYRYKIVYFKCYPDYTSIIAVEDFRGNTLIHDMAGEKENESVFIKILLKILKNRFKNYINL